MKNILVALDFSEHSETVLTYALHLADHFGARVELIHAFVAIPAVGLDGAPSVMNQSIVKEGLKQSMVQLEQLKVRVLSEVPYKKNITVKVRQGEPVYQICEHGKEISADLIVMGTVGESRIEELIFGSTTVDAMRQAPCPVLAVPRGVTFTPFTKMVFASELEEQDINLIHHLIPFASSFDAEMIIFHAFEEDTMVEQNNADQFRRLLKEKVTYPKLQKDSTTYQYGEEAILEEVRKTNANLLVMRERNRSIFNRLFHKDMVRKINDHTRIPLLTFNENVLKES